MGRRGGRSGGIARVALGLTGLGFALALAACAGGASAPTGAPPNAVATPAPTAFNGVTLELIASGGLYHPGALEVPAGQEFEVAFTNQDKEFSHAVYVTEGVRPATMLSLDDYAKGPYPFKGEYAKPGTGITYYVAGLPAGTYQFFCPPHMDMVATLIVR